MSYGVSLKGNRREMKLEAPLIKGVTGKVVALAAALVCAASCSAFEPEAGAPVIQCVDADSDPATSVVFHRDIRPIMDHFRLDPVAPGCRSCHYASEPMHEGLDIGGLNLETLGSLLKGGNTSGANIVVPGKPCSSAIVQKLLGTYAGPQMPKNATRPWNAAEIQLMIDWIAEGAHGTEGE
jgi:hypothetical protein